MNNQNQDEGNLAGAIDEETLQFLTVNRIQNLMSTAVTNMDNKELKKYIFTLYQSIQALENLNVNFLDKEYKDTKKEIIEDYRNSEIYNPEGKDKIDYLNEWYQELLKVMNHNNIFYGSTRHYSVKTQARRKELGEIEDEE